MSPEPSDGMPRSTHREEQGRAQGVGAIGEVNILKVSSDSGDQRPEMQWCQHSLKTNVLSTHSVPAAGHRDEWEQETPCLEFKGRDSMRMNTPPKTLQKCRDG